MKKLISKCHTWRDFWAAASKLTEKQKGDAFELLTQLYLKTRPEYRTKLRHVWVLSKAPLPREIKKRLNLPSTDEGIDLVAQTHDGKFWAIQSKFKSDSGRPPTYKELSTFTNLAFNACAGTFCQALVVHTSSKPVRKRKLLGNLAEIGLERWLQTTAEDWKRIHQFLEGKSVRPLRRRPRPHQNRAIKAAKKHFAENRQARGKLIMPCGTGKSLTAFWIAQELKAKSVLVVVPSLALIKQGVEDWTREIVAQNERPLPEWLCVCSDESAGVISKDEFVGEAYDLGLPVTTETKEIQSFLKSPTRGRRIVFVTYQSSPQFAAAARRIRFKFDLAILDEAHKTAGEKSKSFATLLFDKNLPLSRRIFMTATERVMRGANDEVVSMDKEKVYGNCFFQLTFKDAIHSKPPIISNYKVLTVLVTEKEIHSLIDQRRLVSDRRFGIAAQDPRELASAIALRKAYAKYGIRHAISFHRSILAAADFAEQQSNLTRSRLFRPSVECLHISSQISAGERAILLDDFAESQRALMTNARCLTEGVDVPAIDCVLFADPKQSKIDIVQAAGRALRPYPGKKFGYIMLPIIVPRGVTFEDFAATTEFREVARVISALSTQDERIAEEFRIVEFGKKRSHRIIRFDGSVPVGSNIDLSQFSNAIYSKLWESIGRVNWRPFEEARTFARNLNLYSSTRWFEFSKSESLPPDIPVNPRVIYYDEGWINWGDWLGTGRIATHLRRYRPFAKARSYVRSLNLKGIAQWREFTKSGRLPSDIPANPRGTYAGKGWAGMGDWLGTGFIPFRFRKYKSFVEARDYVRSLGLRSEADWRRILRSTKKPVDIPTNPHNMYANKGWAGMGDWLGTGTVANRDRRFRSFPAAREFARLLKLTSYDNWRKYTKSKKLPTDIPTSPNVVYCDAGWQGWGDWLGTGIVSTRFRRFMPFLEARAFVRTLQLRSETEWRQFTKSGRLPSDIPANPNGVYGGKGWAGMGDWLGTGYIAHSQRRFRPFVEARAFVQELNLKSSKQWREFAKTKRLPSDIPIAPNVVYAETGWTSWGDWLGTEKIANYYREFRSFKQARAFARELKLSTLREWTQFAKSGRLPADIPAVPQQTYAKKGWISLGDWLGSSTVSTRMRKYEPFYRAREFARTLGLGSQIEWRQFIRSGRKPVDIPSNPHHVYAGKGWVGYGDWLGSGNVAPSGRKFRPFGKARAFVHTLKLKSSNQWREFSKSNAMPSDVPAAPNTVYAGNGWSNWGDWLGTGAIASQRRAFRPFNDAKAFARMLKLSSQKTWRRFAKAGNLPDDIPASPQKTYADNGWISWGDWLGSGNVAPSGRKFRPFADARGFVHTLKLKSSAQWREFSKSNKLPSDIPSAPNQSYEGKGWISWGDWLGTGFVSHQRRHYRSFVEARAFARTLNLKWGDDWRAYAKSRKLPEDIPASPQKTYAHKGWISMGDWLGTGTVATYRRKYRPFLEARAYARHLQLRSTSQWLRYARSGQLPPDIPVLPNKAYSASGWAGYGDWLGTNTIATFQRQYQPFAKAREFARGLKLKTFSQWKEYSKSGRLPADIPSNPNRTYKSKGWAGAHDWLGNGK